MDKKQSVKNAILSVVSKHSAQSNLFLAADCKPKQLQNAVSSFAHGCEANDIVVLIDESFMNSGKKGYLFSTEGLYADDSQLKHKNPLKTGSIPMPLRYEELDDVGKVMYVHSNQNDSFSLRYKNGERISVVSKHAQLLSEILRAVLQELRREETVGDSPSKARSEDPMNAPCAPPEAKQPEAAPAVLAKQSVPQTKAALTPVPKAETPKPAAQEELNPDEAYEQGMELYRVRKFAEAFPYLKKICSLGKKEWKEEFLDARIALGWMYENGQGTEVNMDSARSQYQRGGNAGSAPCREAFVRLIASGGKSAENRFILERRITLALEWAKELAVSGSQSAAEYIPVLERLYEETQQAKKMAEQSKQQKEAFQAGVAADKNQDYTEALRQFKIAAELGSSAAMFNCGNMYRKGEGTAVDKAEALRWYLKAAEQGYTSAQFNCGLMYYNGEGAAVDKAAALRWYLKAAEQGDASAQFSCGVMYSEGEGTAVDKAEALCWYLKAAEQGHATAQFNCGLMYHKGEGTVVNKAAALRWYLKAAEQGIAPAQFGCGILYDKGEGTAVDKAEALRWFLKAAEQGRTDAQIICGIMYEDGEGTAVDKAAALRWFLKAAEQGNARAQFNCGVMYDDGEGTAVDKAAALRWYLKAAEQGYADAQFNCGLMYYNGEGTAVDKAAALRWYLKVAEQGYADAQFNCGLMYYNGEGTAVDKAKSKMWFQKAAEQGDERAIKILREYF